MYDASVLTDMITYKSEKQNQMNVFTIHLETLPLDGATIFDF